MKATNPGVERGTDVLEQLEARLRADPRVELGGARIHLAVEDEVVELSGEVPDVAVKRIIVQHALSVPGVPWVVDELRVRPAAVMPDAQIREHVAHSLSGDTTFDDCALEEVVKDAVVTLRRPPGSPRGNIRLQVQEGVVELDGEVPTRAHRRLAVLLAWWVPGTRDVVDGLAVHSRELDSDDELADAVRIALEKDPLLDAAQVAIRSRGGVVSLLGLLPNDEQKQMAAFDAWCVPGVRDVENHIATGRP